MNGMGLLTVHATELRPHLHAHTQDDTLQHVRGDKLLVRRDTLLALEANELLDLLVLGEDLRVFPVTFAVEVGEND
jgi:hypothetical protein